MTINILIICVVIAAIAAFILGYFVGNGICDCDWESQCVKNGIGEWTISEDGERKFKLVCLKKNKSSE